MSKTCLPCTLPCIFVLLSNYLREYFFPLICISCGIRGNTNIPAQHIRNTRQLRVPSDRETIHRHFSLASTLLGKRKTKHWECSTKKSCTGSMPPWLSTGIKGHFSTAQSPGTALYLLQGSPWSQLLWNVSKLRPETRFMVCLCLLACRNILEASSGITHQSSGGEWRAGQNREDAKHNLCPRVHSSMNLSAVGLALQRCQMSTQYVWFWSAEHCSQQALAGKNRRIFEC